ncbi:phage holin family protein [Clostridium botulinum C]|uniref:Phage holin family protein n=2 Tax=Clostridium botulinum TaxID=1491 RepID=A0A9Q4XU21_CLOBO|nr:phage holin family protein [Clostridium botulinum]EGO86524.1 holin [Clostridium botulinum C str. Stockholm]MCD3193915.1 phage holin family protein [Clostridium botulinum C]MCD3199456.1 phage holin family protein [Clostridium botulinum C]MCD3204931.1 phage holin family protein [Clostridium botulinum C]MCD3207384.1 phage holin family protein [Clostridium botulinum C]
MKNVIETIQIVFATIGGYIGWFLGGVDGFMYALITFVIIDYLTGLMVAVLEKKLSSEVGFRGIFKKVLIFVFVGIGNIVDVHLIKKGSAIRTATIFFYISNEGISIIENSAKIGLPVPKKLQDILAQLNKEEKNE